MKPRHPSPGPFYTSGYAAILHYALNAQCTLLLVVLFYVFAIALESFLLYFTPKLRDRPASTTNQGDFFFEIIWPILVSGGLVISVWGSRSRTKQFPSANSCNFQILDIFLLATSLWALMTQRASALTVPLFATVS